MSDDLRVFRYWPKEKPIPRGWRVAVAGHEFAHHGAHSILIEWVKEMREGQLNWSRCEKLLRVNWNLGYSASEIAKMINEAVSLADRNNVDVTRNAVIGKAHRLGLKARPSPIIRYGDKSARARSN